MGKKKAEKELERLQVRLKEAEVSTAAHEPWTLSCEPGPSRNCLMMSSS